MRALVGMSLVVALVCCLEGCAAHEAASSGNASGGATLDGGGGRARALSTESLADLPTPVRVRPSCVLGDLPDLGAGASFAGAEAGGIRGLADLGPHIYDSGTVEVAGGDTHPRGQENNGLVYTCRGGFIDLAEMRDSIDLTLFLTGAIEHRLESGGAIALADLGGVRYVTLKPIDPKEVERYGRRGLAVGIAGWATFQLSLWREIAQWYGYTALPGWPERVSSFSPEDLYSVLAGIKLARGIGLDAAAIDNLEYDRTMDAWIARGLEQMNTASQDSARAAMHSVDGVWWDSSRRLPDWTFVRRRNFDLAPAHAPWLVSMAYPPGGSSYHGCDGREDSLVLQDPAGIDALSFAAVATVEIEVDETLASHGFPFPREDSSIITQADFPAIVAQIRRANDAVLGPHADQPRAY